MRIATKTLAMLVTIVIVSTLLLRIRSWYCGSGAPLAVVREKIKIVEMGVLLKVGFIVEDSFMNVLAVWELGAQKANIYYIQRSNRSYGG